MASCSPALANGPSAAADVVHGRNVSAAPGPHRERQGAWLGRNSWATFFLLFMWPEAIELGQTAQEEFYKAHCLSPESHPQPCSHLLFLLFFLYSQPQEKWHGKSRSPDMVLGALFPGSRQTSCSSRCRQWGTFLAAVMASGPFHGLRPEVVSATTRSHQVDTSFSNKSHMN